jgi:hypothetical protein
MLSKASKIVAATLMLLLLGQPLVACVTAGQEMTEDEHNCCLKMASMCETSAMPASHSCCKHALSPQVVAVSKARNGDLAAPAVLLFEQGAPLPTPLFRSSMRTSESPPESPPKISTVLRI